MQFNVAQLLKEPTGSTRKYDIQEELDDLDPEIVIQAPITGKVKFTKIPQGILVNGEMETVIEVSCGRCLEPFDVQTDIEIEEQFRPLLDIMTGARLPIGDDDDSATVIDERNHLDLTEVVRQDLLLALPNHPLCREDCKGLCPTCGANLNDGECACEGELTDPRWDALKSLLESDNPNPSKKKKK
jgi:uncharacterized protein